MGGSRHHAKRDGSADASTPGRKSRRHEKSATPPPPADRSLAGGSTVSVLDKLDQLLDGQKDLSRRFETLEGNVQQHASRISRLERLPLVVDALSPKLDSLALGQYKKYDELHKKLEELEQACRSPSTGASRRAVSVPSREELDKLARTLVISGWKEPQSRAHLEEWVRKELEL
eukprot:6193747-Amphidinium_carterae.1